MGRIALVLAGVLLSAGCASPPPLPRKALFDEAEYTPFARPGSGVIEGQAFLKTRDGTVKYGAGCPVYLNPVTGYSFEWWDKTIQQGRQLEPGDARANAYSKQAIGDGEGEFRFEGLAPGNYYLACPITWEYVAGYTQLGPYSSKTGGIACAVVTVRDGETTRAVLTR